MADINSYERILKKSGTRAKILMLCIYALILSAWLVAAVRIGLSPALIFLIPLSMLTVILLTWKYTSVEYEYSFIGGTVTFSKIYGKKRRKQFFEAELSTLLSVRPYVGEEHTSELANVEKTIYGIPSKVAVNPCICIFEKEKDKKLCFILDCDLQTAKIFKFFNPSATDRRIYEKTEREENNA